MCPVADEKQHQTKVRIEAAGRVVEIESMTGRMSEVADRALKLWEQIDSPHIPMGFTLNNAASTERRGDDSNAREAESRTDRPTA